MGRRVVWILFLVSVIVAGLGTWLAFQIRSLGTSTRPAASPAERASVPERQRSPSQAARESLFAELQPVKLASCEFARYGEDNDGGYLVCRNLLTQVRAGYSYGISGYDGWGCQISTELKVPVHQYDCFDTRQPFCPGGQMIFHPECVGTARETDAGGRVFDSIQNQIVTNGDADKHVIVKMDVEGAEWDTLLKAPDSVFQNIDQLILEFHGVDKNIERSRQVVGRLKGFFHIAHLHINNYSCQTALQPFGGWAYEVTFVSKRLTEADPTAHVRLPNPLDAPNNPRAADCQAPPALLR